MSKDVVHIGRKIKEVLKNTPYTVVEFAKKINLSRNGAYKVFTKETIDTGQLQNISNVLKHNFFSYYQKQELPTVNDNSPSYGYATKEELKEVRDELKELKITLLNAIEKLDQKIKPNSKIPAKKKPMKPKK
jgi:transcriptional regulator with XRE-family HTH domain